VPPLKLFFLALIGCFVIYGFAYFAYSAKDKEHVVDDNANQYTKEQCKAFLANEAHTLSATVQKQSEMHSFALMAVHPNEEGNETKELRKYIASIEEHRDRRDFAVAMTHLDDRASVAALSQKLNLHGQQVFFVDGLEGANFIESVGRDPNSTEEELIKFTDDTFISPIESFKLLEELKGKADGYYENMMREHGLSPTGWHIIFNYVGFKAPGITLTLLGAITIVVVLKLK
jgi:hypothetical protein